MANSILPMAPTDFASLALKDRQVIEYGIFLSVFFQQEEFKLLLLH